VFEHIKFITGAFPEGEFPLAVVEMSTMSVVTLSLFGAQEENPRAIEKLKQR